MDKTPGSTQHHTWSCRTGRGQASSSHLMDCHALLQFRLLVLQISPKPLRNSEQKCRSQQEGCSQLPLLEPYPSTSAAGYKRTWSVLAIQDQTSFVTLPPPNSQPHILSSPPATSRDAWVTSKKYLHCTPGCHTAMLQNSQEKPDAGQGKGLQPPAEQSHRTHRVEQQRRHATGTRQDANFCL